MKQEHWPCKHANPLSPCVCVCVESDLKHMVPVAATCVCVLFDWSFIKASLGSSQPTDDVLKGKPVVSATSSVQDSTVFPERKRPLRT